MSDPTGMSRLLELGVRNVPVLARGREFVFGQVLADVARLAGVRPPGSPALSAAELVRKWSSVLAVAQQLVQQIPQPRLSERAVANRDRSVRYLAYHVFRIVEAFLEVAEGAELTVELPNVAPQDPACSSGDIARYGEEIVLRLAQWWGATHDDCARPVETYYGAQPLRDVLERCVWHSAQHVRQLDALLRTWGIEPAAALTPEDVAGLPLPAGIWE